MQPPSAGGVESAAAELSLLATYQHALERVSAELQEPTVATVKPILTEYGFSSDKVEVSQSLTPTGLDVDAISVALTVDGQCFIGQIRSSAVATKSMPPLDDGRCLIGSDKR